MLVSASSAGPGHGLLVPTTSNVVSTKPSATLPRPKDSVDSKDDEKGDDDKIHAKGLRDVIEEEQDQKQFQEGQRCPREQPSAPTPRSPHRPSGLRVFLN